MRDRSEHAPRTSDHDPTQKTQTATRRAAKATFRTRQEQIPLKITTFPAPAIIPNFTTCCACHKKWHMNFIKCCTWHEKWHMNFTKYCACHAKGVSRLMHITYETSFTMRGATRINFQPHQILRLPRKKECYDWSASHMKRHLQCAEQQASTSNLTKYCACHAKLHSQILEKFTENSWSGISNARPIRAWSENIRPCSDPKNANRNPPRRQGYFSHSPGADSIENYNVSRSGYHSKFHHMLHLPQKVTHKLHQMLHLARKVTQELHQMLHLPQKVTHELHRRLLLLLLLLLLGLLLLGLLLLSLLLLGLLLLELLLLGLPLLGLLLLGLPLLGLLLLGLLLYY